MQERGDRGYPSFWDAVANRDVGKMIKESKRNGLPERNKAIQDMLRKLKNVRYKKIYIIFYKVIYRKG